MWMLCVPAGSDLMARPFTAQRVAELAKMDGGIVVDDANNEILQCEYSFHPRCIDRDG